MVNSDGGGREELGFAPAVEQQFSFLANYGFDRTRSEPDLVRFDGNGRYIEIFHGRRSYAIGAQYGIDDDPDAKFSLPEVAYAFRSPNREYGGHTKEAVEAAVKKLAEAVLQYAGMLDGPIPFERIQEYRTRLTEYYAGKSTANPDQKYKERP